MYKSTKLTKPQRQAKKMTSLERLKKFKQAQRESEVPRVPEPAVVSLPVSDDEQILVDWFLTAALPTQPFNLDAARRVNDPAKFYDVLRREIEGTSSARWRCGATQADLRALKAVFE